MEDREKEAPITWADIEKIGGRRLTPPPEPAPPRFTITSVPELEEGSDGERPGAAVVSQTHFVEIMGAVFSVRVHFGAVDGRAACVGIDLRSFVEDDTGTRRMQSWSGELNSPRWRAFPIAEQVDWSRSALSGAIESMLSAPGVWGVDPSDKSALGGWAEAKDMLDARGESRPKRGRSRTFDDAVIVRVVAPAYRAAVRRPVQAVQQALTEAAPGLGLGPSYTVTIDQARKAVSRARELGALPPADRRGRR